MMQCKNCGKNVEKGANFCPECGVALTVARKKKRWVLPVCLTALLVVLVICGVVFFISHNSAKNYIGTEKGIALTDEEAEQILLSDITDEEWAVFDEANEALSQIVSEYSNENGYIDADDTKAVINAVAAKVNELYEESIVAYYVCNENGISFEYTSGLKMVYFPFVEGDLSGGNDVSIVTVDLSVDDLGNTAFLCGQEIHDILDSQMNSYQDEEVNFSTLVGLPESSIFIWYGHGGFVNETPLLITNESTSLLDFSYWEKLKNLNVSEIYGVVRHIEGTWCITSKFVKRYISLNQGMVYLNACHSLENEALSDAFTGVGAEVVFGNTDTVSAWYGQRMMKYIINCMDAEQDEIYHTADEALEMANELIRQEANREGGVYIELSDYEEGDYADRTVIEKNGIYYLYYETVDKLIDCYDGAHVDYSGVGIYTLCPCIRGAVSFEDNMTESDIADIIETLSVELDTEDGEFVMSTTLSSSEFCFNNLEPGTYQVKLFTNGKLVYQDTDVIVSEHRYTPVDVLYTSLVPLEGYVFDEEGQPISGVSVVAEMVEAPDMWNVNTTTDEDGYYYTEVFGVNSYTLSYSADGYLPAEQSVTITKAIYENAQRGEVTQLEDVVLISEDAFVYLEDMEIINSDRYTDNEGDSFINVIGTRNGTVDIYGNPMTHGLEAWIARWNFTEEESWAWVEYDLGSDYYYLTGKITIVADGLIGYNVDNFNSEIEIYGDGKLIYSLNLYPGMDVANVELDIENVDILRIYVYDTEYAKGGTSFGLWDFRVSSTR